MPSDARLQEALADRYRLEGQLGRGGMATVYLAHDLERERRVAQLQHPHKWPTSASGGHWPGRAAGGA